MRSLTVRNSFQLSIAVSLLVHMAVIVLLSSITPREAGRPRAYFVDIVEEKPSPPPPPVESPLPSVEEIPPPLEKPLPSPEKKPRPESMFGENELTEIPPRVAKEAGEDLSPSGEAEEKGKGEEPVTPEGLARGEGLKKLFDAEVIQEFAKKEPVEEEGGGITFSTKEFRYVGYVNLLGQKLVGAWNIPKETILRGIPREVVIEFVIRRNGLIGSIKVLKTSGDSRFDSAAIMSIKNAEPYWPLPEAWELEAFPITGTFSFTTFGKYIY